MTPITIIVPPNQSTVTITVHLDGKTETAVAPAHAPAERQESKSQSPQTPFNRRVQDYIERNGGFCSSNQLVQRIHKCRYALKIDEDMRVIRKNLIRQLALEEFMTRRAGQHCVTFYVLPEFVTEFMKHAKKQRLTIIE